MSFQGSTEWMQGWRSSDCWRQTVPRPGSSDKKRSVTQWRPSSSWYDERWRTRWSQTLSGLHSSNLLKLVGQVGVVPDYVDTWTQWHIACTVSFPGFVASLSTRCNVICLHSMTDQTSCCVDNGLESVQELCRKADQQRITVFKLCQHKTGDERHNSMTR